MLHKSGNSGTEFPGQNQLRPCVPVLTPNISCTKLKIHSAHADRPILPKQCSIFLLQLGRGTSLYITDQETQEENLQGGTSSPVGQLLHPISLVQSSRPIQRKRRLLVPKQFFSLKPQNSTWDQSMLHRTRNSGRELQGGIISLRCQFLHPMSLVQSLRFIQRMQTVQFSPNIFLPRDGNLDIKPIYASQNKKRGKRICRMVPAPLLCTGFYTQYLLFRPQDPFSACRHVSLNCFSLVPPIWMQDQSMLHRPKNLGQKRFLVAVVEVVTYICSLEPVQTVQVFLNRVSVVIDFVKPVHALQNRKSRG